MKNEKEIVSEKLDQEWIILIREAREIGLSVKEVKEFLGNKSSHNKKH
ncbi:SinR repressor domain-containing protein dimerization (plasmid) [Priestia aryabhattai]